MTISRTTSLFLIAAFLGGANAQAEQIKVVKDVAILGSLVSYAFAYANRGEFEDCSRISRGAIQGGSDEELNSMSVAFSFAKCDIKASARPLGLGWSIEPTVMFSQWSANAGPGANASSELSFIPKVQYVLPVGSTRLDATFGIGASFISNTSVGDRIKSSNFQFTDEVGIGISDSKDQLRLGLIYRHVSNLGIALPNNGVDFRGVTLSYRFD
jgi:Lipid A 3-O-deacylase (PagL)